MRFPPFDSRIQLIVPLRPVDYLTQVGWRGVDGQRHKFTKPSQGQKLCRGFKSRPLRHYHG